MPGSGVRVLKATKLCKRRSWRRSGHDEAAKVVASQSPEAVVLEALLVSIHEKRSSVRVKEITILTNAIFSQRRETMALSCKAVGAIINDLFERRTDRKSKGYEMSLDSTLCA